MSDVSKHAYLIIAHTNFHQLQTLISLLDDVRNDIFIHIDKKASPAEPFRARYSKLIFVDRISVIWGGHSQIQCELNLLKAAAANHYQYYHLISGMDLPLKTQDEIHRFFDDHDGSEFIASDPVSNETGSYRIRVKYYYPFQNVCGREMTVPLRALRQVEKLLLLMQRLVRFSRKEIVPSCKGISWFSITDHMAQYLLANERAIRKQFFHTFCGDEIFLLSFAMASPYRSHIVDNSLRAIDWDRGCPYTYRAVDVPALLRLPEDHLWARKFDETVDAEAIALIAAHLRK